MEILRFFQGRKKKVDILSILFGIGSWIAVNGMWVELPIMVQELPEQWNLPSYLSVIIQLANVAPLAYSINYTVCKRKTNEAHFIHAMMLIGSIACFLLAFLWDKTAYIGGNKHSVALITLIFFLAIVDCSSSVLFFPFMGLFKAKYMTPFLIGESLSGFIPSIVALGQGAGSTECRNVSHFNATTNETTYKVQNVFLQPRFSIEVFFFFLTAMTITSWTAFSLLKYHPVAESEKISVGKKYSHEVHGNGNELVETDSDGSNANRMDPDDCTKHLNVKNETKEMSKLTYIIFLIIQAWICFLSNGVLPSVQTYSSLPYGQISYHLSITLSSIASPAVCVAALFITLPKKSGIVIQATIGTAIASFLLATALLSPTPPLAGKVSGEIIIVIVWILSSGIFSFTKVCIANSLREKSRNALFWYGAATQIGSGIGAITLFLLMNVAELFKHYQQCQ